MIAVILAGGQSTRMGQDKGLMEMKARSDGQSKTWVEIIRKKLTAVPLLTFVSINSNQRISYSKILKDKDLIIDNDQLQIEGPLRGLMSAHLAFPNEDIVLTACDMVNIESAVIKDLIANYEEHFPEAVAYKSEHIEPLCAIYSARALQKIRSHYNNGLLMRHSLMNVLETLHTRYLPLKKEQYSILKNFNQAEDLN